MSPFERPTNGENELRVAVDEQKSLLFADLQTTDPSFFHQDCYLTHLCFPHHEYSDQVIIGMLNLLEFFKDYYNSLFKRKTVSSWVVDVTKRYNHSTGLARRSSPGNVS